MAGPGKTNNVYHSAGLNLSRNRTGMLARFNWLIIAIGIVAACSVTNALAHQTKLSSSRLTMTGGEIAGQIELNAIDLNVATGATLTGADNRVDAQQLTWQLNTVQAYVEQHVVLSADGEACEATWQAVTPKDDHDVLARRSRQSFVAE